MDNRDSQSRGAHLLSDAAMILLCTTAVYSIGFCLPTLFPEIAWFWQINRDLGWTGIAQYYLEFDEFFYRPTSFYLYFGIVSRMFGWHNIYGFRIASVSLLLMSAMTLYAFIKLLFPRDTKAPLLAAVMYLAHPAAFVSSYENTGFDYLYVSSALLTVIFFLLLERSTTPKKRIAYVLGGIVCYAFSITCKELPIVTPVFIAVYYALTKVHAYTQTKRYWTYSDVGKLSFLAGCGAVLLLYYFLHISNLPDRAEGYRTVTNLEMIKTNLLHMPLWAAHIFVKHRGDYSDAHVTLGNKIYAAMLMTIAIRYWAAAIRRTHRKQAYACHEHNPQPLVSLTPGYEVTAMLAWAALFLAIPIYSGYALWHVLLATLGFIGLFSVAIDRLLSTLRDKNKQYALFMGIIALITICGVVDYRSQIFGMRYKILTMNAQAVTHPPVAPEKMPKNALIYVDKGGLDNWSFSSGTLFKFAYLDPTLEVVLLDAADKGNIERVVQWVSTANAFFFSYDEQLIWRDATAEYEKTALPLLRQHLADLIKNGKQEEARKILEAVRISRAALGNSL